MLKSLLKIALAGGLALATCGGAFAAPLPLDQRPAKADEWGYRPADGEAVRLNPPSWTWIADARAATYSVQWSTVNDFSPAATTTVDHIAWPTYTHHASLSAGAYFWRYRYTDKAGAVSEWSKARKVIVPAGVAELPMPTVAEQRARVPQGHPRLFMRPTDVARLRELAQGREKDAFAKLKKAADFIIKSGPTPEPEHKGSARDKNNPELIKYWWPNRVQAEKACEEAETLAFVYLLTGDKTYGEAARRWVLHLASWDPKGNTNFSLNCEAGKPMLFRPARAYDWAWDMFTPDERAKIQGAMRERLLDAWNSGEVQKGVGHLQKPFNSHGNRTWHKIGEAAIAFLDEIPEAPQWLDYAVNKFYSCYPVWSDDDGGWHEGVSYWSGYQNKVVWWLQVAQSALAIDGLKKPFFAQVGDYPLYISPPNSPNSGFGDLSARPVSAPAFLEYHLRARSVSGDGGNAGYWAWWAQAKQMPANPGVLGFLYRANLPPLPSPKPPTDIPQSKIFHGIGIASLHTTLADSRDDVHFLMKASPMGSQSHGHNPQNSFQLNAYGEALLVANGYRDLHGSKFHYQFVHTTRAQNAVLVDGQGQIPHSRDATGTIVREELTAQYDYIVGDATPAYGRRLERALRHAVLVKGAVPFIVLYDDLAAPQPATFQFMLHGLAAFTLDEAAARLTITQPAASAQIVYLSPAPLAFKQTDGFEPKPSREFPNHWHVEAGTKEKRKELGVVTVILPYRTGQVPAWTANRKDEADGVVVSVTIDGKAHSVRLPKGRAPVQLKLAGR